MSATPVANAVNEELSPEALEAAPKAWYDDLNMTTVLVSGFVSTILTIVTIAIVQGLFFQWQYDAIKSRKGDTFVSPGQAIIASQKETLSDGSLPTELTGRIDGSLYYPQADKRVLISMDEAKKKVLDEYKSGE